MVHVLEIVALTRDFLLFYLKSAVKGPFSPLINIQF